MLAAVVYLFLAVAFGQNGFDGGAYFTTPPVFPSPNTTGAGGWEAALSQANAFVAQLNLTEKAYMTTGISGPCVGTIRAIPRLNFSGLCLHDGPAGIRQADLASAFPAGLTAAATWDKALIYQRGLAMAQEFKGKGAHVILGPVVGKQLDPAILDAVLTLLEDLLVDTHSVVATGKASRLIHTLLVWLRRTLCKPCSLWASRPALSTTF